MNEQLEYFVLQAQQAPPDSPERQQALVQLTQQILKARQVARPFQGCLMGIYQEIAEQAQAKLQQVLDQRVNSYNYYRNSPGQWAESLRQEVLQVVLSRSCLQQLALAAQQHEPRTHEHQYAISEVIQAIRFSGKLARTQLAPEIYQDAINQTLMWVCQNIQTYSPDRGDFMAWVNYRLDKIGQSTQQSQKDPYTQATQGKVIKVKYQLNALIQQLNPIGLRDWLSLYVRRLIPTLNIPVTVALMTIIHLSVRIQQAPTLANELLFEAAQDLIDLPPPLVYSEDLNEVDMPQEDASSLADILRQYIEKDPDQLLQKHMQGHPDLTLQTIILARLDGESWKSLSQRYRVKIPALSNFFQRSLASLAPQIRTNIQQ
jgi:hypothetical protein